MSKRLVLCVIKDGVNDVSLIESARIGAEIEKAVRSISQEGCSGFTTAFDKGNQHNEMIACSVMTRLNDEDIKRLIEPICNSLYTVHILK